MSCCVDCYDNRALLCHNWPLLAARVRVAGFQVSLAGNVRNVVASCTSIPLNIHGGREFAGAWLAVAVLIFIKVFQRPRWLALVRTLTSQSALTYGGFIIVGNSGRILTSVLEKFRARAEDP